MLPPTQPLAATQPVVLLTGFDAFGGDAVNPSWLAVQQLDGRVLAGHRIVAAQLPTQFGESLQKLKQLVDVLRPQLAICVGQAGGRAALSIERVAINIDDAPIPDNAGRQPVDEPIAPRGPAACFSTLPIKAMMQEVQHAGLAVEISQTAGTFVCNHVFYGLMQLLRRKAFAGTRGGFIHVPWLPEQAPAGQPCMPLKDMVRGLEVAVRSALAHPSDLRLGAGATH
jgi:pyroglutamyl-peptidase